MVLLILVLLNTSMILPTRSLKAEPSNEEVLKGKPIISRIQADARGGAAYSLIYLAPIPIDVFWKFKTDFGADIFDDNKFVKAQRVLDHRRNVILIENKLSINSAARFRWRNTLYSAEYRLDFVLTNPEQCGQRFHHGHFKLEPVGSQTKVLQTAYFDFLGVSIWVNYPGNGGMVELLDYIARWEQRTSLKLRGNYEGQSAE